ncbi:uncharacterized protein BT62DRAFT_459184 [Guyanagaster necrorhizus]|uniref:Uncharacterized protein n=1 Tax=Guyanagaster necrorhizus TaxID=856835 RepID=A0A9P8ANM5_9AGAR|nr:uncharacterized protein BT62DRAFT_459184 [Guyanagaster necrorhizus MCA 3950]KAG7441906.1 hypothetical protein BT62DRAFT_459184 [Guyanagaster necrorhizus MCA 3950]
MFGKSPQISDQVRVLPLHSIMLIKYEASAAEHLAPLISSVSFLQAIRFAHLKWTMVPQALRDVLPSHVFQSITHHYVDINTSNQCSLISGSHNSLKNLEVGVTRGNISFQHIMGFSSPRIMNLSLGTICASTIIFAELVLFSFI